MSGDSPAGLGGGVPWEGPAIFSRVLAKDELLQDVIANLHRELQGKEWLLGWDCAWSDDDITVETLRSNVFIIQQPEKGHADPAAPQPLRAGGATTQLRTLDDSKGEWDRLQGEVSFTDPTMAGTLVVAHWSNTVVAVSAGGSSFSVTLLPYTRGGLLRPSSTTPSLSRASSSANVSNSGKYKVFISRMKDPCAAPLIRSIKRFIPAVANDAEQAAVQDDFQQALPQRVSEFLESLYQELKDNELWAGASAEELAQGREGIEKYVLCKIHQFAFGKSSEDVGRDARLAAVIDSCTECPEVFTAPRDVTSTARWKDALGHLQAAVDYKAPYDKLICVSNCCRIAQGVLNALAIPPRDINDTSLLRQHLPHIIYTARVPGLVSHLSYIKTYCRGGSPDETAFLQHVSDAAQRWMHYTPLGARLCLAVRRAENSAPLSAAPLAPMEGPVPAAVSSLPLDAIQSLVKEVRALQALEGSLLQSVGMPVRV